MIVGVLIVCLALLSGAALYISFKSYKLAYIQEEEALWNRPSLLRSWLSFLWKRRKKSPSSTLLLPLYELKENKGLELKAQRILSAEEADIFHILMTNLPLTHVHVFPCVSLSSFLYVKHDTREVSEFCRQHGVCFLIAGKKSKMPLMAIDCIDAQGNDERLDIACATKKLLLQRAQIPYVIIKKEMFKAEQQPQDALEAWIKENIALKFKL